MHKGQDVGYIELREYKETKDEIKLYKYGRVLSADEAHYNISGFPISEIKPPVKRLGYFVPGDRYINVEKGSVPEEYDGPAPASRYVDAAPHLEPYTSNNRDLCLQLFLFAGVS